MDTCECNMRSDDGTFVRPNVFKYIKVGKLSLTQLNLLVKGIKPEAVADGQVPQQLLSGT